jgi:hypothetical protein
VSLLKVIGPEPVGPVSPPKRRMAALLPASVGPPLDPELDPDPEPVPDPDPEPDPEPDPDADPDPDPDPDDDPEPDPDPDPPLLPSLPLLELVDPPSGLYGLMEASFPSVPLSPPPAAWKSPHAPRLAPVSEAARLHLQ